MKSVCLDTPRILYDHCHRIAVYCGGCERWSELSFIDIDRMGKADTKLPDLKFRCGDCGEKGQMQIRTPAPTAGMAHQGATA